ncbi:MAG: polyphenol oxidase family protein [Deltaproteobacteria bacterium]|nr:polyphenol oxidase family protein [Deltaproteobacteria bacterium]
MRSGNGETDDVSELGADAAPAATCWRVSEWDAIPQLVHGFLGRAHGLGPGAFDLDLIRARLIDAGETPLLVLAARQVHAAAVLSPEDPAWAGLDWHDPAERLPAGDALVTASADVILTIRTADCVPILLVAPGARAVAAVHAGWRGLLAGVVERSVAALGERYGARPATIEAALGPAIGACCYEFGAEHQQRFVARYGATAATAWRPGSSERGHLDVRSLAALALRTAGLNPRAIRTLGPCTAEHLETLHSYRRDGARAGRQLSYIGWRAD